MITYFAHNGIDHASAAEAADHQTGNQVPIILLVTAVVVVLVYAVVRLLSRQTPTDKPADKKDKKV